jgi:hypothetical protein
MCGTEGSRIYTEVLQANPYGCDTVFDVFHRPSFSARILRFAMDVTPFPHICQVCGQVVVLEECKSDEHARAVHEHWYVAQIASHRHQITPTSAVELSLHFTAKEYKYMKKLCTQILTEKNQWRFLELAEELQALLDRKRKRLLVMN